MCLIQNLFPMSATYDWRWVKWLSKLKVVIDLVWSQSRATIFFCSKWITNIVRIIETIQGECTSVVILSRQWTNLCRSQSKSWGGHQLQTSAFPFQINNHRSKPSNREQVIVLLVHLTCLCVASIAVFNDDVSTAQGHSDDL